MTTGPGSGSLQLGLINVAYRRCVLGRPSVRARPRSWSSVSPCRVTITSLLLDAGLEVFVSMPHTSPGGQRQDAFCMVGRPESLQSFEIASPVS